jgi:hypothetical protein
MSKNKYEWKEYQYSLSTANPVIYKSDYDACCECKLPGVPLN